MLEQLAAPTVYPVSLATAKSWLRETTADSDAVITRLLKAAVARAETASHNAIVFRSVREKFDYFPPCFDLLGYPVRGVRSITYLDPAGVAQTLVVPGGAANYIVSINGGLARVMPAYAQFFPPTRVQADAVQVIYDIGLLVPVTAVDAALNTLTAPGHNKAAGDIVQLSTDGGTLPGGVTAGQALYVVNPVGDTIQVAATSGGAAIDLTAGFVAPVFIGLLEEEIALAMQLMMDTWFRNRSSVSPNQIWDMPPVGNAEALLSSFMPRGFQ